MDTKCFRTMLVMYNCDKQMRMEHWVIKHAFVKATIEDIVYLHHLKGIEKKGEEAKYYYQTRH